MPDVVLSMGGFGAFGKIAATGDFVRHAVPGDFVAAWDGWLQAGITGLRERFGAHWQDVYFAAPLWRFSLAPGVAGGRAMLGVMMPSVDRVGRHFPLTIVACVDDGDWAQAHFAADALFESLEDTALATLDDLPLAALKARLAGLSPPPTASDSGGTHAVFAPLIRPAAVMAARAVTASTLWSARLDQGGPLMQVAGLPQGDHLRALFDMAAPFWSTAEGAAP